MSLLVDNPIINSPFEGPTRYWAYGESQSVLKDGQRAAGYYLKARTRGPNGALGRGVCPAGADQHDSRAGENVAEEGISGCAPITRQLLSLWNLLIHSLCREL